MTYVSELKSDYDFVIVGARCAGAATAMLLAKGGARVLAIDRQCYGSDTLSTHALMRPAVIQLKRWGLLDRIIAAGAPVVTLTTFHYGPEKVEVPIRAEPGLPGLVAPRRTLLDRMLVDAARSAGATIVHDVVVQDLVSDSSGRIRQVVLKDVGGHSRTVSAGWVVGADGVGSLVARQAGAQTLVRGRTSAAHIYSYAEMPRMEGYHWYYDLGMGAAFIPTDGGLACVAVFVPTARYDAEIRLDIAGNRMKILRSLDPGLAEHVAKNDRTPLRAFRGTPGHLRQAFGAGWVLVGDAGFFRDPITSHGISDALRDAEGAADALLAGSEAARRRYQQERDEIVLPILEATDAIATFDGTLDELPARHRRFSEAMKPETAVLAAREERCTRSPRDQTPLAQTA